MNPTAAPPDVAAQKVALRRSMRARRRDLDDIDGRSARITDRLDQLAVVRDAATVMVFASLPAEPQMDRFSSLCQARGQRTMVPEDDPDSGWPDVVIVPGIAFTRVGARLGQGGGWYDRFLVKTRPDCALVGVAFDVQILDELPLAEHDVALDAVVTETRIWWTPREPAPPNPRV